jgi:hypothetical protein
MNHELKQAYKQEAIYQTKQYKNLQKWLRNSIIISSLGILLIIYGKNIHFILLILGYILTIISVISSIVIGFALRNGQSNIQRILNIIDDQALS